jgi:hypothetical protein
MSSARDSIVEELIRIEAHVHYGEPPPPDVYPFVTVTRESHVLISAPHGSRTFRNSPTERWHEEDEYTAGIALLLGERCRTCVIANVWRSDECDPNQHPEDQCAYKRALRKLAVQERINCVLDLHGAASDSRALGNCLVDLGTRKSRKSMDPHHRDRLHEFIEAAFGKGSVSIDGFAAVDSGRITAFCQEHLKIQAVQIEMKPAVRVPLRRCDASAFAKQGPFSASHENVVKMIVALETFIRDLTGSPLT